MLFVPLFGLDALTPASTAQSLSANGEPIPLTPEGDGGMFHPVSSLQPWETFLTAGMMALSPDLRVIDNAVAAFPGMENGSLNWRESISDGLSKGDQDGQNLPSSYTPLAVAPVAGPSTTHQVEIPCK